VYRMILPFSETSVFQKGLDEGNEGQQNSSKPKNWKYLP